MNEWNTYNLLFSDAPDVGPSICIHTGAPWGLKNVEMDKDAAAVEILKHSESVLPGLPEPVEVKGHKWRYSQVIEKIRTEALYMSHSNTEDDQ